MNDPFVGTGVSGFNLHVPEEIMRELRDSPGSTHMQHYRGNIYVLPNSWVFRKHATIISHDSGQGVCDFCCQESPSYLLHFEDAPEDDWAICQKCHRVMQKQPTMDEGLRTLIRRSVLEVGKRLGMGKLPVSFAGV